MIQIELHGNWVYIVTAKLLKEDRKTFTVRFSGKVYVWPRIHSERMLSHGVDKFAIRVSFYNAMYDQKKTKKLIKEQMELQKNPIRRISKN